jgi:DNA repair protein RadB
VSERVATGCGPLDELLEGGLERGATTQLYGPPAAGKTNVALSAAIETAAGGDSALIIDTEGLSPDRMQQLLDARAAGTGESPEAIAERVIVSSAHDFDEQEAAVQDAADLASRLDLIVLDSATGFYRLARDPEDGGEALRRVGRQLTHLLSLARKHDLAVLFTNQVFTDPDSDQTRALGGHTLDHWSGAIVRLDRFRGGNRRATLEKHRSLPAGETVQFQITDRGIEGTPGRPSSR